jgi:hypothetical protein
MILLFVALIIGIRVSMGPGPTAIKTLPPQFPADLPIYDRDNIDTITYITGRYKSRGVEIAALFPKIILSSLFLPSNTDTQQPNASIQTRTIKDIWKVVTAPVGDHRDTVQLEWNDLATSPTFLYSYYKNELRKKDFKIKSETIGGDERQFTFARGEEVVGSVFIKTDPNDKLKTIYSLLTVNFYSTTSSVSSTIK